jgi:hypothetical protein
VQQPLSLRGILVEQQLSQLCVGALEPEHLLAN